MGGRIRNIGRRVTRRCGILEASKNVNGANGFRDDPDGQRARVSVLPSSICAPQTIGGRRIRNFPPPSLWIKMRLLSMV